MDVKNSAITAALVLMITYVLLVILYQIVPNFDLCEFGVKLAPSVTWQGIVKFIVALIEAGVLGLYLGALYAYLYKLISKT